MTELSEDDGMQARSPMTTALFISLLQMTLSSGLSEIVNRFNGWIFVKAETREKLATKAFSPQAYEFSNRAF